MQPPVERPYWNPYVAGFALGLVLLGSFLVMGFGLGSSSVPTRLAIGAAHLVAPAATEANAYFAQYVGPGKSVLQDWLVFEVLGVLIGAFVSGLSADRLKLVTEKGPRVSVRGRLLFAAAGGALFGAGAQLARGCTSGAALSGMAVLSVAGFVTMLAIFGSGFLFAWFTRSLWLGAKAGR